MGSILEESQERRSRWRNMVSTREACTHQSWAEQNDGCKPVVWIEASITQLVYPLYSSYLVPINYWLLPEINLTE